MSKSAIFTELAKVTGLPDTQGGTTSQVQPASERNTLDWLTSNFDRCDTTWKLVTKSNLTKEVKAWKKNDQQPIFASTEAYTLLSKTGAHSALPLMPYSKPELSQPFGITMASAALAETGTLVMHSAISNPPSLHFLCDHHCVLLWKKDIFRFYEDYWKEHAQSANQLRAINFISGPSRTADVEQTIQIGAHGPVSMHVLIIES